MKNVLLLAVVLGSAALAAPTASAQTTPTQSKKEIKRKEKERKRNGPEVYKGSVAEQRRIITDAPGAEKESDDSGDEASASKKKAKRKN